MATINERIETINLALVTLKEAIESFDEQVNDATENPSQKNLKLVVSLRDSMIQRFEYCTDLFWKVLKLYLENIEKITLESNSPRGVIRAAVQAKILSEKQGIICMQMVDNRNMTSHMYHQEIAEEIAARVPEFYTLMRTSIDGLSKKVTNNRIA